jgi:hypothetical protein
MALKNFTIFLNSKNSKCIKLNHLLNISPAEREMLHRLLNAPNLVIEPADKGGALVLINHTDYDAEAIRLLSDRSYYSKIPSPFAASLSISESHSSRTYIHLTLFHPNKLPTLNSYSTRPAPVFFTYCLNSINPPHPGLTLSCQQAGQLCRTTAVNPITLARTLTHSSSQLPHSNHHTYVTYVTKFC